MFQDFIVLTERRDGLTRINVMHVESGEMHEVAFPDPVYSVWTGHNAEFESTVLRYGYTSLVAPMTDVDYDMTDRDSTVVKVQPVRGGYDVSQYTSERAWVTADDGTMVPLSIVRRTDTPLDGSAPALIYGYGAYEYSSEAVFRAARLSLLDRGFVFAIVHVRGGGELGRPWYEGGRLDHKINTFTDFIVCAEFLVDNKYTSPARLVARGASAGGLLMGTITNLRPDLFAGVVAEVPFVDVLTTMLDPSLPLTVTEWEEWGDPRRRGRVQLDARILALRQRDRAPVSRDVRHVRVERSPRAVLGAGEVGAETARVDDQREADRAADRARGRPRRPEWPLRRLAGRSDGPRFRLHHGRRR